MSKQLTRRDFLETAGRAAAGAAVGLAAAGALRCASPGKIPAAAERPGRIIGANYRILMGLIGCGGRGRHVMQQLMNNRDCEFIALCDVDQKHLDGAGGIVAHRHGKPPALKTKHYRELLDRKEIDAVLIATPDHWHALQAVDACEAGKDIYLEKPIAHDILEGRAIVNAAQRKGTVIQVGTWQRSQQHYVDAIDFVRSGALGGISIVRTWTCGQAGVGRQKPQKPPAHLDWDLWVGPAPYTEYAPNRCHGTWRWFFDYGTGLNGDWGVHIMDIALLGMNQWHPMEVAAYGGKLVCGPDDDRTTPDTCMAIFKFADFVMQWEIHVGSPGLDGGGLHGTEFLGQNATLTVDRARHFFVHKGKEFAAKIETKHALEIDHERNFLDCVKTRERPRSDIESMHYTTTMCHLANASYLLGRSLKWDWETESFVDDREANRCDAYCREYRKPWKRPKT